MISYGEAAALASACIWSFTSLILRQMSQQTPAALITAIRCGVAGPFFWIMLAFWGPPLSTLTQVPAHEWALLVGSVVTGIVIGDQLYLHAMKEIGVSRTMALVGTFPITTLFWEQLLLNLPTTQTFVFGCILAASGVIALSYQTHQQKEITNQPPMRLKRGVVFSLCASLLWGLSTTMLKPAIAHLTTAQTNSIRMPLVTLALLGLWRLNRGQGHLRDVGWRRFLIIASSGLLGMGIGSYFYIEGVAHIGPAKTATISAITPVLSLAMGVVFLKEPFTLRLLLGVGLCVMGVWLVL